jgi:transposase-like protein
MTLNVAMPMSYVHERYFGRPSCPKCGELMMAPESSKYLSGYDIRHSWVCDGCNYQFETLIRFNAAGARRCRDRMPKLGLRPNGRMK